MKKAHRKGQWRFPKSKDFLKEYPLFAAMINKIWKITWYAYIGASLLDPRFSIQYSRILRFEQFFDSKKGSRPGGIWECHDCHGCPPSRAAPFDPSLSAVSSRPKGSWPRAGEAGGKGWLFLAPIKIFMEK